MKWNQISNYTKQKNKISYNVYIIYLWIKLYDHKQYQSSNTQTKNGWNQTQQSQIIIASVTVKYINF